jgi:chromate transport protein ChrA
MPSILGESDRGAFDSLIPPVCASHEGSWTQPSEASLAFASPTFVAIVLVPAAVAGVSALTLAQSILRFAAVAGTGLLLAVAFVLAVYLRAPTAHAPKGCSDCGLYLGRWWEPGVVLVVAAFGLAGWLAGSATGALARRPLGRKLAHPRGAKKKLADHDSHQH